MGWRAGVVAVGVVGFAALAWLGSRERSSLTGLSSCPACYGLDACPLDGLDLACRGTLARLAAFFGVKNVMFACSDTLGEVVLKKLGHDWQLNQLDFNVCSPLPERDRCDFDTLPDPHAFLMEKIENIVSLKNGVMESDEIGLTVCPDPRSVRNIVAPSLIDEEPNSVLNRIAIVNIWTIMNINPEPVILKYINQNNAHWPVPLYLGACGRVTMQTYEGEMISNYLSEPWILRAKLSVNLLKAADLFTFDDENYGFYLTDISPENIVVNSTETWEPVFIDLENVIIVDKNFVSNETNVWRSNHSSEVIECHGCFAFSSEKICKHHLSDHNHYSICKLLDEFILKYIPNNVSKISPDLLDKIENCVSPPTDNIDRFTAANILRDELNRIILTLERE